MTLTVVYLTASETMSATKGGNVDHIFILTKLPPLYLDVFLAH